MRSYAPRTKGIERREPGQSGSEVHVQPASDRPRQTAAGTSPAGHRKKEWSPCPMAQMTAFAS
jgi:hypothetical protein